jgi:ribosomal protein S18 acetylase RimI-like enzyme
MDITLRPATFDDSEFVFSVKREALGPAIERTWGPWDEDFQRAYHDEHFDPAKMQIVTVNGDDAGCLSVEGQGDEVYITLIELLPAYQNLGIGTRLLQDIIARAALERKPVSLEVLKANEGAKRLYDRLGFEMVPCEKETHYRMVLLTDFT